ncbi:MAG: hypothetical protein GY856_39940 [bacterium]|nr:hypothetical protein [bacterium]
MQIASSDFSQRDDGDVMTFLEMSMDGHLLNLRPHGLTDLLNELRLYDILLEPVLMPAASTTVDPFVYENGIECLQWQWDRWQAVDGRRFQGDEEEESFIIQKEKGSAEIEWNREPGDREFLELTPIDAGGQQGITQRVAIPSDVIFRATLYGIEIDTGSGRLHSDMKVPFLRASGSRRGFHRYGTPARVNDLPFPIEPPSGDSVVVLTRLEGEAERFVDARIVHQQVLHQPNANELVEIQLAVETDRRRIDIAVERWPTRSRALLEFLYDKCRQYQGGIRIDPDDLVEMIIRHPERPYRRLLLYLLTLLLDGDERARGLSQQAFKSLSLEPIDKAIEAASPGLIDRWFQELRP